MLPEALLPVLVKGLSNILFIEEFFHKKDH